VPDDASLHAGVAAGADQRGTLERLCLRQTVKNQPKYAAEIRTLQEQVLRLTAELHAARRLLSNT
jgi:hypothetical protein